MSDRLYRAAGSMSGRVRYDSTPRLREHLRECPPGTVTHVRVVDTRVVTEEAGLPFTPHVQVLVVVYDLADEDEKPTCGICDGSGVLDAHECLNCRGTGLRREG